MIVMATVRHSNRQEVGDGCNGAERPGSDFEGEPRFGARFLCTRRLASPLARDYRTGMPAPTIIDIPHKLGRDEVKRRMQGRIGELASRIPGGAAEVASSWPG